MPEAPSKSAPDPGGRRSEEAPIAAPPESILRTHLGGLFLLVPAMEALGLPHRGAGRRFRERAGGWALLHCVARQLVLLMGRERTAKGRASEVSAWGDDPVWRLLEELAGGGIAATPPSRWLRLATARLVGFLRERMVAEGGGPDALGHVLVRPARVEVTRTHLDVQFGMEDADRAIRAAGLDLDPGWVPWLGRIVLYHYG